MKKEKEKWVLCFLIISVIFLNKKKINETKSNVIH